MRWNRRTKIGMEMVVALRIPLGKFPEASLVNKADRALICDSLQ